MTTGAAVLSLLDQGGMHRTQEITSKFGIYEAIPDTTREALLEAELSRVKAERELRHKQDQIHALARVLRQCFDEITALKAKNAALERACQAWMVHSTAKPCPSHLADGCDRLAAEIREADQRTSAFQS